MHVYVHFKYKKYQYNTTVDFSLPWESILEKFYKLISIRIRIINMFFLLYLDSLRTCFSGGLVKYRLYEFHIDVTLSGETTCAGNETSRA